MMKMTISAMILFIPALQPSPSASGVTGGRSSVTADSLLMRARAVRAREVAAAFFV